MFLVVIVVEKKIVEKYKKAFNREKIYVIGNVENFGKKLYFCV